VALAGPGAGSLAPRAPWPVPAGPWAPPLAWPVVPGVAWGSQKVSSQGHLAQHLHYLEDHLALRAARKMGAELQGSSDFLVLMFFIVFVFL